MNDIEEILRQNKPSMPTGDTFLVELNAKLEAAETAKDLVARERRRGRIAVLLAAVIGITLGCLSAALIPLLTSLSWPRLPLLPQARDFLTQWPYFWLALFSLSMLLIGVVGLTRESY